MDKIVEEALSLAAKRQFTQAETLLQPLLASTAPSADVYYAMGVLRGHQEKYSQSLNYFLKAADIDPFFCETYENLTRLFEYFADVKKALNFLQQQLTRIQQTSVTEDKKGEVYFTIALAYAKLNEQELAFPLIEKSILIDSANAKYQSLKSIIY